MVRERIRTFIQSNLNVFESDVTFADADNIFRRGFVNSLFAVQLIAYLEKEFAIKVANRDMNIANFSSVDKMVEFVERKRAGDGGNTPAQS
jgi:methoxymalonate biosynthesis acyl carrier protein